MEDVVLFTEELLKQDYYYALLFNGMSYLFKTRKEMDRYHTLLPEIKLETSGHHYFWFDSLTCSSPNLSSTNS
jgi:hypothetical protein